MNAGMADGVLAMSIVVVDLLGGIGMSYELGIQVAGMIWGLQRPANSDS